MKTAQKKDPARMAGWCRTVFVLVLLAAVPCPVRAVSLEITVTDPAGNPVSGFRWLVEEDNTNQPIPGVYQPIPGEPGTHSLAVDIHKSHAPVVATGHTDVASAAVDVPGSQRYVVSVLPDSGYTMGGGNVEVGVSPAQMSVIVNAYPVPTAQISILVFWDTQPINNAPEVPVEQGLQGFSVVIADAAGQQMMDAFGNPLGTTYQYDAVTAEPLLDPDGQPLVETLGSGIILTDVNGEALIKYVPPGKYGVQIIPPAGQGWIQTTTIEGTHTIDAWVKAGEPEVFVEFGPAAYHVFVGFVQAFDNLDTLPPGDGTLGSITGKLVFNHFSRPPTIQGFFSGPPVEAGWVGLNESFSRTGVYAAPADGEGPGEFTISNIPAGTYQLVTWDENLDSIFGFHTVTMPMPNPDDPDNPIWDIDLGDVLTFRWYGTLEGSVFYDFNENGFRDPEDIGMRGQEVLLRFRDGTIYQATATDFFGEYTFEEVFPFFKWLVPEVDFLRFKATGVTNVVDYGGEIPPDAGWDMMPSFGKLNPQPQAEINPNTGNNLSRTEVGEVLTQAMHLFLGQTNVIDWGKAVYGPGESGGITGIVYYAVTRAEDEPRWAAAEAWEPGVPRVQVALYEDQDMDGIIDDLDGDLGPTLADVDNYPLGWIDDPAAKGPEDVDRNDNGSFDPGDAIQITTTDSWDDSAPTGCIQDLPVIHGETAPECFDNFGTWNQIRPGVFDGGFAFASYFPGGIASGSEEQDGVPAGIYIVEATPPAGYETVKEEDKNVDYGDSYEPGLRAYPPACVGDLHTVPDFLTLFGDIEAPCAGEERPLCDRKQVIHDDGQNTGVEFFLFSYVPKAARAVGFINNDLAAEFDQTSPVFGEKQAPAWVPISFQDYAGNEIVRVYSDEYGAYNALLPSTYTVNIAAPSGVSPHMISFVVNHPGPIPDPEVPGGQELIVDPYFDPSYSQTPYTFNFESGKTTYLDTPVIPVAAFAGYPTGTLDTEPPDGTPVLHSVLGSADGATGPVVCIDRRPTQRITIQSLGHRYRVTNPETTGPKVIRRDYGFGNVEGQVTLNGVPLTIRSWNQQRIRAEVNTDDMTTGHLVVTRGDNGLSTPLGITLHILDCNVTPVVYLEGGATWPETPIQDAIDAAAPGTLIVVGPGTWNENPIIYKNVKLQGAGAGSTSLNGNPVPFERVTAWHATINALIDSGDLVPIDAGMFEPIEAPCVFVHGADDTFDGSAPGLIDGFTILGGVSGGGVYLAGYADYFEVSSNKITNNQGTFGGAITIGISDADGFNDHVNIHHNTIAKNGGINGGGGLTIFRGCDNYTVADNLIIGNFSRNVGGGVAHIGLSDGGTIARNQIAFNEVFYGAQVGGEGGGIYIGGTPNPEDPLEVGDGAGSVTVVSNLLQGNLAGSGSGGGLRALDINGQDVVANPDDPTAWYALNVFNNLIVNNVAAFRGGGIALQDAARATIIHNTVADNDCTATASLAFPPGTMLTSNPQGAGIVGTPHSPQLVPAFGAGVAQTFSNPELLNNVVWHNRSFHWEGSAGAFQGALAFDGFWDLQVVGGGSMAPQYCILSDATGYDPSNFSADPLFLLEYQNTLLTAALIDEAGNAISVRYTELNLANGDYHIASGSPAVAQAGPFPALAELAIDYDGDDRPALGADVGADEFNVGAAVSAPSRPAPDGSLGNGVGDVFELSPFGDLPLGPTP